MRRAAAMAIVLVLAFATPAQAGTTGEKVTGDFAYDLFGTTFTVSLDAHATDPPSGVVHWTGAFGNWMDGSVSCVSIDGSDAWVAGPLTNSNPAMAVFEGFLIRLHDGGTPGTAGDTAVMLFYWQLDDPLKACEKTATQIDRVLAPLTEGNLTIH